MWEAPVRAARRTAVVALVALAVPASAAAAPQPFGHSCTPQNGVRLCATTEGPPGMTADGPKSFDGTPLDADVTLPATGDGPWPTIVMLTLFGQSKTEFQTTSPEGPSPDLPEPLGLGGSILYHYNDNFFAKQGYAVLTYTPRGFFGSCGHPAGGRLLAPECANGFVRLGDSRYEARDTQQLLGMLVDEGIADPAALAVTGFSYGGAQTAELAFLKNRISNTNGSLAPWTSPAKHTPLSIAAAWARAPAGIDEPGLLFPNGRFLDFAPSTIGSSRSPIGILLQSYTATLLSAASGSGYFCGEPPASPCPDPHADLFGQLARVDMGEPYGADVKDMVEDLYRNHDALGIPYPAGGPSPLLLETGWTDDLSTPGQVLRAYNLVRGHDSGAPISLMLADFGHLRGQNKPRALHAMQDRGAGFLGALLQHSGTGPAPGSVLAFTQTCPLSEPDGGPFAAPSWPALHPASISFGGNATQTVTATGDAASGPPFDPVGAGANPCTAAPAGDRPGTAVYTLQSHGVTLLGLPTVRATIKTTAAGGQLDSRLYDVRPDGSELLITRGAYRLTDGQTGRVVFQLNGNAYVIPPGDTIKLELRGNDAAYLRPSNDTSFRVEVSKLSVELPVPGDASVPAGGSASRAGGAPLRLQARPRRANAGRRRAFRFALTALVNRKRVPVAGAAVRFAGRRARTNARGLALLRVELERPGRYTARARKAGFRDASAPVHAT
jgi:X-Pro dipeptidyl-peptidase (S15 family)/X-Pro dipeptidyl-peptidase C-terminal non-catalytic domain